MRREVLHGPRRKGEKKEERGPENSHEVVGNNEKKNSKVGRKKSKHSGGGRTGEEYVRTAIKIAKGIKRRVGFIAKGFGGEVEGF